VREGDPVRAGQVVVRLDDAAARADVDRAQAGIAAGQKQVEVAKAQAALAASTLSRYDMLRERKSVSPQEYDEVERHSQAAAAQLEAAKAQLAAAQAAGAGAHTAARYSVITAPFAGTVTGRHVDPGALAAPGTPLVDIDRAGPLQLQVTVDESVLRTMQQGRSIQVSIPSASQQPLDGMVAQIVPAADPASHTFLVKIDLPKLPNLHAGMYGTASVGSGARMAVAIPESAVVAHGSLNSVWALDNRGVASIRYVTLGARFGKNVEVLSGLSSGELVVLSAGDRELAGVQIASKPSEARP
jgi:RND family efflux transporter MFP subunit